jgi:hypothetical protein
MYIKLGKYVIHQLNSVSDLFILIYSGAGGHEVHETFQGGRAQAVKVLEPLH